MSHLRFSLHCITRGLSALPVVPTPVALLVARLSRCTHHHTLAHINRPISIPTSSWAETTFYSGRKLLQCTQIDSSTRPSLLVAKHQIFDEINIETTQKLIYRNGSIRIIDDQISTHRECALTRLLGSVLPPIDVDVL